MIWALLAGALAFLFGSAAERPDPGEWEPPSQGGLDTLRSLCAQAGVSQDWAAFLAFVAYGESRWNNLVGLGVPSRFPPWTRPNMKASQSVQEAEALAAKIAWERNRERFEGCGHPSEAYWFGSGGWFGMLPANGLAKFAGTPLVCLPPSAVFDPPASIAMALGMARALMGWSRFKKRPTWLNLRVMWGCPSCGGDPAKIAAKRAKFEAHAKAAGLPDGWLDQEIPSRPPGDIEALYRAMGGGGVA